MMQQIAKKEKIIIHGAGHTDGKYREPENIITQYLIG